MSLSLYPEKEIQHPSYRRLGGPWSQFGQLQNTSPPPVFDPRTIQPVSSCYTDYAILHKVFKEK